MQGIVGGGVHARDGSDGVAVLMRYTLRLLTAQQFQRAAALICACEELRRERWSGRRPLGRTPFRIGLWVGRPVTPNSFDEARRSIEDSRGVDDALGGPLQPASCPWCGSRLAGRTSTAEDKRRRVLIFCSDPEGNCVFSRRRSRTRGCPCW